MIRAGCTYASPRLDISSCEYPCLNCHQQGCTEELQDVTLSYLDMVLVQLCVCESRQAVTGGDQILNTQLKASIVISCWIITVGYFNSILWQRRTAVRYCDV